MVRNVFMMVMLVLPSLLFSQRALRPVTTETQSDTSAILSYRATSFVRNVKNSRTLDTLIGNVRIVQDSLFLRCDRAVILDEKIASAVSNVVIIQHDTIHIFADSLIYNGETKIARLFGEVVLKDGNRTLHTTQLTYDASRKRGHYHVGGTLIDADEAKLISKSGYYDVNKKVASFKKNVIYEDSLRRMTTDSLEYHYQRDHLYIVSPTRITQDTTILYCRDGLYDVDRDRAVLSDEVKIISGNKTITAGLLRYDGKSKTYRFLFNPEFVENDVYAKADTMLYNSKQSTIELMGNAYYSSTDEIIMARRIFYDEKTDRYRTIGDASVRQRSRDVQAKEIFKSDNGITYGIGGVVLEDTVKGISIYCDQFELEDSTDVMKAYNRGSKALMVYKLDTSVLLLRADTLISFTMEDSLGPYDFFTAYNNVEFVKSSVAGISDSLTYSTRDSVLWLYRLSYLWSDSTQMSGDTISITLKNNSIDKVELKRQAFVISPSGKGHYNQIKGNNMTNWFDGDRLRRAEVIGNTELVYFVKDDKGKYKGINITRSSRMTFQFSNDSIDEVRFYKNPESDVHEYLAGIDPSGFHLEGFSWFMDRKPFIAFIKSQ